MHHWQSQSWTKEEKTRLTVGQWVLCSRGCDTIILVALGCWGVGEKGCWPSSLLLGYCFPWVILPLFQGFQTEPKMLLGRGGPQVHSKNLSAAFSYLLASSSSKSLSSVWALMGDEASFTHQVLQLEDAFQPPWWLQLIMRETQNLKLRSISDHLCACWGSCIHESPFHGGVLSPPAESGARSHHWLTNQSSMMEPFQPPKYAHLKCLSQEDSLSPLESDFSLLIALWFSYFSIAEWWHSDPLGLESLHPWLNHHSWQLLGFTALMFLIPSQYVRNLQGFDSLMNGPHGHASIHLYQILNGWKHRAASIWLYSFSQCWLWPLG